MVEQVRVWITGFRRGAAGRDVLVTAGANFAIAAMGAAGGIIAARLLGPEGRGEFAAAVVWGAVLSVIGSLGLPQALTYYTAQEPTKVGAIFHTALGMFYGQSVLVVAGGWLAITFGLGATQPTAVGSARLYLLGIPPLVLITHMSTICQGLQRFALFAGLRLVSSASFVVALVIASLTHRGEAREVVLLLVTLQWVGAVIGVAIFLERVPSAGDFDLRLARRMLAYGMKSYWGSLSWMANMRLDQFIMSALIGLPELGQYAVAVSYATVLFPVSGALAMVLFPRAAASEPGEALKEIKRVLRLNLVLSTLGAVVLGIASPVLLPWLFGPAYQQAICPAMILLVGTILLGTNYVASDGLRGMGAPLITSLAEVGGLVMTVGGLWLVVYRWGIRGAATVSVLSYGLVAVVLLMGLARAGRKWRERV